MHIRAWCRALLFGLMLLLGGAAFAQQQAAPAAAPAAPAAKENVAPSWDITVNNPFYASVPGRETNVLIQDGGWRWRELRNGPITFWGGVALVAVPLVLLVFYFVKGRIRVHSKLTGRLIERFNSVERVAHWTMAISFCVLALTGIAILFGKHVLLPVLGYGAFAWITNASKVLHNFVGPLFLFSVIVFIALYLKDNVYNAKDGLWFRKFGGLLSGEHVPSGRFNGGEKTWFWLGVCGLSLIVSISGLVLNFPNFNQTRGMMQTANLVHVISALIVMAMSLGHIYLGTIGMEGAYKAMREGHVDEVWAKEHHELWYEQVKSQERSAAGGQQTVRAQPADRIGPLG